MRRVIAAVVVAMSGCSYAAIPRVRPDAPCSRAEIVPVLDRVYEGVAAVSTGMSAVAAFMYATADAKDTPFDEDAFALGFTVVTVGSAVATAVLHRSADFGFREVARCRAGHRDSVRPSG